MIVMALLLAMASEDGDIEISRAASFLRDCVSSNIRQIAELFSEPDICFASVFYQSY
jgi:hypothetical protein